MSKFKVRVIDNEQAKREIEQALIQNGWPIRNAESMKIKLVIKSIESSVNKDEFLRDLKELNNVVVEKIEFKSEIKRFN